VGVFEFVILLVLISGATKVLVARGQRKQLPSGDVIQHEELAQIRDTMAQLSGRMELLEQERDFYKDLLDAPRRLAVSPPEEDSGATGP